MLPNFFYRFCLSWRRRKVFILLASFTVVWFLLHSVSLYGISNTSSYTHTESQMFEDFLRYAAMRKSNDTLYLKAEEVMNGLKYSELSSKRARKFLAKEICAYSNNDLIEFPNCKSKLDWMKEGWKSDGCYAERGVDGSYCSFILYLSEVENHCPYLFWRKKLLNSTASSNLPVFRTKLDELFESMNDSEVNYAFIKTRISRLWPQWIEAFENVKSRWPKSLLKRQKLTVLIHLGFLTKEAGFKFGQKASSGGPLGELVQWSDLIAALYVLGHDLLISSETATFKGHFDLKTPCPDPSLPKLDLLFTDIVGVRFMRRKMKAFFLQKKCILRILDSFGSHAEFNNPVYFNNHRAELGRGSNPWGGNGLELQQFMTMYPHTDDNSFLGFVVEMHSVEKNIRRENITLVYGKEIYMWKDSSNILKEVSQLTQLHATVADVEDLSNYTVINHGLLSGFEFHSLLRKVKIFFGLGFPLEGPAPLEAIANGAVFLNPKFDPPKSRRTYKFFKDKPTLRELTSQNPYVERFIGKPHVLTVNISDSSALKAAVIEALGMKPEPFLPFEFTTTGMLQRVNIFVNKQNFCLTSSFPPPSAMQVKLGKPGISCQETCAKDGLVCERSFFKLINSTQVIEELNQCTSVKLKATPLAPYSCVLQSENLLYSCASVPSDKNELRICPCRDFIKGQIALCSSCV